MTTERESFEGSSDRLVHALLCGLHDRASEPRVRLVMSAIQSPPRRTLARLAAVLLVGAGILIGLFLHGGMPDAEATLRRASLRASEDIDRQYRVTVSALRPGDSEEVVSRGLMHVRGTRLYAYEFEGPFRRGWLGSDGVMSWHALEGGETREWPVGDETRWKAHNELRYVTIDTYVRNLEGRFDFSTVGKEGALLHLRATRKAASMSEVVTQIDFWIADDRKLIVRSLSRLEPARLRHPLLIAYEYVGEVSRPADFYTLKARGTTMKDTKPESDGRK